MQAGLEKRCTPEMSQSERGMISEVLKHYDFYVDSVDKVRSAYKICTSKGIFCLKRVSHGYKKAKKSFFIAKYLKDKCFDNLAEYYYTKEGKALVKQRDAAFYLTYWIDGREASFKNKEEILRCSEFLAYFHNMAKDFEEPKHVKVRSHVNKWGKSFAKCRDELEGCKEYIDKMKLKAEFDYIYRSNIDHFHKEAEFALKILEHSRYNELCDYYKNECYICHDSFYYQNIIIDREDRLYIVDMESCQYDIPVSDLGKLIRRVLSKKRFKWDFDLCRRMIESYCRVRPMAREEYELLLAMLVFPHKFWKLGRKRYVKGKKWSEEKYRKKLRRLLREGQYKREFIYCYINFYDLDLEYDPDIIEL
ncbi:MAG TPA: CotS family spore coat protein [Clostridia bacterium]|nr:CotS family spore coat protein [Clostridia bacterium]